MTLISGFASAFVAAVMSVWGRNMLIKPWTSRHSVGNPANTVMGFDPTLGCLAVLIWYGNRDYFRIARNSATIFYEPASRLFRD